MGNGYEIACVQAAFVWDSQFCDTKSYNIYDFKKCVDAYDPNLSTRVLYCDGVISSDTNPKFEVKMFTTSSNLRFYIILPSTDNHKFSLTITNVTFVQKLLKNS